MNNGFLCCAVYLAVIGVAGFIAGRLFPKDWFRAEAFPYRAYPFEREGRLYNKLHIRKWQNKLPDMSKILPGLLPAKRLDSRSPQQLAIMLQETCVAECIHDLLFVLGHACLFIWQGVGGLMVTVIYNILGNLPFILIQRYNRPRLLRLLKNGKKKGLGFVANESRGGVVYENAYLELQHRAGT